MTTARETHSIRHANDHRALGTSLEMKDSGVEWIGRIPRHWTMSPLHCLTETYRQIIYGIVLPGPNVDDGVPIVKGGDIKPERLNLSTLNRTTYEIEASYKRSRLKGGDLVYAIRGGIGDVEVVPAELEGANITQDAARIAAKAEVSNTWLKYALTSQPIYAQLASGATGAAVRGVNIWALRRALIPVPPRAEQELIAAYLDVETKAADNLVTKYERLIGLLEEKRVALTTQAVTKGLDQNVPMKDTGVERLGWIPAHWTSLRLRFLSQRIETGGTPTEQCFSDSGVPWYTPGDFCADIDLRQSEKYLISEEAAVRLFPAGSILIVSIGATLGKIGLASVLCSSNQQCNAVIPRRSVHSRFLAYALSIMKDEMTRNASASTLAILNQSKTKDLFVAMPPTVEEQVAISEQLDSELSRSREAARHVHQAIALTKEHRAALITAAVTGQIDVATYRGASRTVEVPA